MKPLPTVVLLHKELADGCSVEFHCDPYSKQVGVLVPGSKKPRMHASTQQKQQLELWQLIQKERKRLGLDPLTTDEMII